MRRILHLDIDAFLASVEQAEHPELRGRPVVIGGLPTSRNLVMSCSYEARAHGVRSGMLLAEAAKRCPQASFRHGDSQAAGRYRAALASILLDYTPCVEVASIDDFYADLSGTERLFGPAFGIAEQVRARAHSEWHLPVTIGIGANRCVARIAGKLAKPSGIAEILPGMEARMLACLPLRELPGAGHALGRELERYAIRTCGELALVPREVLYASFGRAGLALQERARGVDPEPIESSLRREDDGRLTLVPPQSLQRVSTFEPEEGRREHIEAMLLYLVERAAHKLRQLGCTTRSIRVELTHVDTRTPAQRAQAHSDSTALAARARLDPTHSSAILCRSARELLRSLPRRRALVKRVGLALEELAPKLGEQRHLFDAELEDRAQRLECALDRLREKHGFGRVLRGSSLLLAPHYPLGPDGLRLRTPSLNQ
jgi:DNA polymerase IV